MLITEVNCNTKGESQYLTESKYAFKRQKQNVSGKVELLSLKNKLFR